jgi:hypothetical protein
MGHARTDRAHSILIGRTSVVSCLTCTTVDRDTIALELAGNNALISFFFLKERSNALLPYSIKFEKVQ